MIGNSHTIITNGADYVFDVHVFIFFLCVLVSLWQKYSFLCVLVAEPILDLLIHSYHSFVAA